MSYIDAFFFTLLFAINCTTWYMIGKNAGMKKARKNIFIEMDKRAKRRIIEYLEHHQN